MVENADVHVASFIQPTATRRRKEVVFSKGAQSTVRTKARKNATDPYTVYIYFQN